MRWEVRLGLGERKAVVPSIPGRYQIHPKTSYIRYHPHQMVTYAIISHINILPSIAWACMVCMLISLLKID